MWQTASTLASGVIANEQPISVNPGSTGDIDPANNSDTAYNDRNYSSMFGGGPGGRRQSLEARQAAMTRDQWQNFLEVYRPVEQELMDSAMQTDFSAEGDAAGRDAQVSATASKGMLARNLSRLGTSMTAEQAAAVRRRQQQTGSKSIAQAENVTRKTMSDSRSQLLQGLVGIGRGVATGSMGGINAAANNAANQEMAINQGRAAAQNSNMATAASLAAMLIMLA